MVRSKFFFYASCHTHNKTQLYSPGYHLLCPHPHPSSSHTSLLAFGPLCWLSPLPRTWPTPSSRLELGLHLTAPERSTPVTPLYMNTLLLPYLCCSGDWQTSAPRPNFVSTSLCKLEFSCKTAPPIQSSAAFVLNREMDTFNRARKASANLKCLLLALHRSFLVPGLFCPYL